MSRCNLKRYGAQPSSAHMPASLAGTRGRSSFDSIIGAALAATLTIQAVCISGAYARQLSANRRALHAAERTRHFPRSRGGQDVVGKATPPWGQLQWINSHPRTLKSLRGKVVLIRFWTDTCPFCAATAPALRAIDSDFGRRGLVVIGMYHPKPYGSVRPISEVSRTVDAWAWKFPVALDTDWKTLRAFWLDAGPREATSASFLIDRKGVIRFVHPGPEFHPGGPPDHAQCRADYRNLRIAIQALLAESG